MLASLSQSGIKLNVTAIMTLDQVSKVGAALSENVPAVVSVFAGRIADTGRDPIPHMREALESAGKAAQGGVAVGEPARVLNIFQADDIGCHIITVTSDASEEARASSARTWTSIRARR